jgi:hypothetical protein
MHQLISSCDSYCGFVAKIDPIKTSKQICERFDFEIILWSSVCKSLYVAMGFWQKSYYACLWQVIQPSLIFVSKSREY